MTENSGAFLAELRALLGEASDGDLPTERGLQQLGTYFELLQRWGRVQNLTKHLEPRSAARESVGDAWLGLAALERVLGRRPRDFMDVGSGAGIPGVVAGVRWADVPGLLVEPLLKRVSFLEEVSARLGLSSLAVRGSKVEDVAEKADVVMSRATVGVGKGYDALAARVREGGALCLFVGPTLTPEDWSVEAARLGLRGAVLHAYRDAEDRRAIACAFSH